MNEKHQNSEYANYWLLLKRKWLPATLVGGVILALNVTNVLRKPDIYRSNGLLLYKSDSETQELIGLDSLSEGTNNNDKVIAREISVLKTTPVLKKILETVPESVKGSISVSSIKRNLSVEIDQKTDVVQINFESQNPKLAFEVVNNLMQVLLQRNVREKRASTVAAGEFIANQLPEVRSKVLLASRAIQNFQEKHGVYGTSEDLVNENDLLIDNQKQLTAVETELAGTEKQLSELRAALNTNSSTQSLEKVGLSQSLEIQTEIQKYRDISQELDAARSNLTADHPALIDLSSKLNAQNQKLLAVGVDPSNLTNHATSPEVGETKQGLFDQMIALELSHKALIEKRQSLLNQNQSYTSRISSFPALHNQYRELQRELQAAEHTYDSLLARFQELKVSENEAIPNVEIIEPAQLPASPVLPNRLSDIVRGAIASILLAYVTAFILDRLDKKIRTIQDIRSIYPSPVLGTIPELNIKKEQRVHLPVRDQPTSSVAEAYRMLQANLRFLQSDQALKVISVSSAVAGEGKSASVANLALALSESYSVLVIDADLRRPTQHQIWELNNLYGLSNFLADIERPFQTLKQEAWYKQGNLTVMTAGAVPPNPVTLLESQRMQQFLDWCRQEFDYVLIDLPPVNVAADALFVGKMADGLLLVGRPEQLNRTAANHCIASIHQAKINLLGVIVNGLILRNEPDSYYYYQSYYNSQYYTEKSMTNQEVPKRFLSRSSKK